MRKVNVKLDSQVIAKLLVAIDKLDLTNEDDPYSDSWEQLKDAMKNALK